MERLRTQNGELQARVQDLPPQNENLRSQMGDLNTQNLTIKSSINGRMENLTNLCAKMGTIASGPNSYAGALRSGLPPSPEEH